ncbi:MAG: hypothetical protein AB1427_10320 [Thermodesulfobacteriota bacterium]
MKKKLCSVLVGLLSLLSLGMGKTGENSLVNIPRTEKNFSATLVDQADLSMELERFSFDGQTFLTGKFGKSDISIDFEKIDSVAFLAQANAVKAGVRLKDGQLIEIMIEKKKACFGASSFANVRIEVQDIKKVSLRLKQ